MFSLIALVTGAKDVLPLVPGVIKAVERLRAESSKDPTLGQVVEQVREDTLEGVKRLKAELTHVLQDKTMKPQLDVPLSKVGDDLSWFKNPVKKLRIQRCRDHINQVHRDLDNSTDQFASVLTCMDRANGLGDAYATAAGVRRDLDAIVSAREPEPPVGEVLALYVKMLDKYIDQLSK